MSAVVTLAEKVAIFAALKAASGLWDGAKVGLFVNDVIPNQNMVTADFTEPAWTGYAQQTLTWATPYANASAQAEMIAGSKTFISGSDADDNVYGFFVTDSGGTLIYGDRFATPIPAVGVTGITALPVVRMKDF